MPTRHEDGMDIDPPVATREDTCGSARLDFLARTAGRWRARSTRWDWAVLAVALAIGCALGTSLAFRRSTSDFADEAWYLQLARSIIERGEYANAAGEPTAWKPPLLPALYSLLGLIGGIPDVTTLRLLGLITYLASGSIMYLALRRYGRPGVGLIVGVAMALSPAGLGSATSLYPQVYVGLLCCIAFWVWTGAMRSSGRLAVPLAGMGLLLGLGALGHPSSALPIAGLIAVTLWSSRRHLTRVLAGGAAAAVGFALPVLPWMIRNLLVVGKFTLATGGGVNLFVGNNPNATPGSGIGVDTTGIEPILPRGSSEAAKDAAYSKAAWDWMADNPLDALQLYVGKLLYFFWPFNSFADVSGVSLSVIEMSALTIAWVPFVLLAIARVVMARLRSLGELEWACIVAVVLTAATTAFYFSRVRYRIAVDPFVYVLAGTTVSIVLTMISERSRRCPAANDSEPNRPTGDRA